MWARPINIPIIEYPYYSNRFQCPYCTEFVKNVHMSRHTKLTGRMGRHTYYTRMVCNNQHMFILAGTSWRELQLYEICTDDMLDSIKDEGIWRWYIARKLYIKCDIQARFKIADGKTSLKTKLYD